MTSARKYAEFLESVSPQTLEDFDQFVGEDVYFSDPFHQVRGIELFKGVFSEMFMKVGPVRFEVSRVFQADREAVLIWKFSALLMDRPWIVPGTSRIVFDQNGKVIEHIDYWDSGRYFLMHLPVIGRFVSWLYRRVGH